MGYTLASLVFAALFAGCAYTLGLGVLAAVGANATQDGPPPRLLAIPAGTGVLALLLFVLASIGALRPAWIIASIALAVAGAGYIVLKNGPAGAVQPGARPTGPWLRAAAGLV